MSISTTLVAQQYLGIAANVPIFVNMPMFDVTEYEVVYGVAGLTAVRDTDYIFELALDFQSFNVVPYVGLLTKIAAEAPPTNVIVVRQVLSKLTSTSSAAVRNTTFTSLEFDRVWRGIQEVADGVRRSLGFADNVIVNAPKMTAPIAASQMLATDATGTKIVSGGNVTDFAGAVAAAATAVAAAATATAQVVLATAQAVIATAQAVIATTQAGISTAQAAAALASANAAIVAKMVWRSDSPWATGRNYGLNDVTRSTPGLGSYICVVAHLSGASFAADLAASKWQLVAADGANGAGTGDMLKATYDPTAKNANAFAMDNMTEGATTKIMTATERTKLAGIDTGAQVTSAANVAAAISAGGIKTAPVDADVFAILDSAASFALKYVSGTALKLYLWANVALTGNTSMAGDLTMSKATPKVSLNKAASGQSVSIVGQQSGNARWGIQLGDATAESGSAAGSLFSLDRYDDAGTLLDSPLTMQRNDSRLFVNKGQLAFPATQNASSDANTLDDYEEGTWTPSWSSAGSTFSYATQEGFYVKIGRAVTLTFALILNTSGNTCAASALTLSGLPFAMASGTGFSKAKLFWLSWEGMVASFIFVCGQISGGSALMPMFGTTAAATNVTSGPANASTLLSPTAGSGIRGNFPYVTGS